MAESSERNAPKKVTETIPLQNITSDDLVERRDGHHMNFSAAAEPGSQESTLSARARRLPDGQIPRSTARARQTEVLDRDGGLELRDLGVSSPRLGPHPPEHISTTEQLLASSQVQVTRGNGNPGLDTGLEGVTRQQLLKSSSSDSFHPLECAEKVPNVVQWYSVLSVEDPASAKVNLMESIQTSHSSFILVVGAAGMGKTTLCTHVSSSWAKQTMLEDYRLVLFVRLDRAKNEKNKITSLEDLFQLVVVGVNQGIDVGSFQECVVSLGSSVLIIVDGLDEYDSAGLPWKNSVIQQLLTRKLFPNATLLVTARPSLVEKLEDVRCKFDQFITICGFSAHTVYEYFSSHLKGEGLGHTERLREWLREKEAVGEFCSVPVVCSITLELYRARRFILPKTVTETSFMISIVLELIKKELAKRNSPHVDSIKSLDCLPGKVEEDFELACQLALMSMSTMFLELDLPQLARAVSAFCTSHAVGEVKPTSLLGLMEGVMVRHSGRYSFRYPQFLHPSLLHFLMAMAVQQLPLIDQLHFFHSHLSKNGVDQGKVVTFHFGISSLELHTASLNPSKIALISLLEVVIFSLDLKESSDFSHLMFLFNCVVEGQEPSLWKRLGTKYPHLLKVAFRGHDLDPLVDLLSSMVSHSGISKWEFQVTQQDMYSAETLKVFVDTPSNPVEVVITVGQDPLLIPKVSPGARARALRAREGDRVHNPMHSYCCKCIKDVMHRVCQLYSPVTIQSYHADPGYISIVACPCLEASLNSVMVMMPVHAGHTVPMPRKPKKRDPSDEKESHWQGHGMMASEVIVMTTPYPVSLSFTIGTEEFIRISSEQEGLSPRVGRIDAEIEQLIVEQEGETLVECTQERHQGGRAKIIVPGMGLPRKGQVVPKLSYTKDLQESEDPNVPTSLLHLGPLPPLKSEQSGPQQARQSQSGRGQQAIWTPGTMLYTVSITSTSQVGGGGLASWRGTG